MPSISGPAAGIAIGGGLSALGSLGAAGLQSSAAQSAAQAQIQAAQIAAQVQMSMFNRINEQLGPYRKLGQFGSRMLMPRIPELIEPPSLTMGQLQRFPGYRFTLDQGLKATQNAYAAQGLGISGPAIKGAENYATGLASTTYQQAFGDIMAGKQLQYGMLGGLIGTGETAAAQTGQLGVTTAGNVANLVTGAGAAAAGGIVGSANAIAGGIGGATGNIANMALLTAFMQNPGMFQGPGLNLPASQNTFA